jgi:hypothetical protein
MTGLFTDSTSNGFLVDITAPVVTDVPKFASDLSLVPDTQFYRTLLKVEWSVNDPESHIERQYLSVKSHIGGEFDLASTKVYYNLHLHHRKIVSFFISSI